MNKKLKQEILGALARGYCSESNSNKVLDEALIKAQSEELFKVIEPLENIIVDLLSEIEDISPAGTKYLSEELLEQINELLPDND
jgi:hypothetical protein